MSNDKQNQQGKDWTIPIAVAAIACIGTITAAIIGSFDKLPFLKSTAKPEDGEFIVKANKPGGKRFTNEYNSSKKYNFYATGEWTYNKTTPGVGKHGPEGHPNYKSAPGPKSSGDKGYYLPGEPEGALIIRRGQSYEFIGDAKTLLLKPNETVYFTINDTNDPNSGEKFKDNEGEVTVEWHLQK